MTFLSAMDPNTGLIDSSKARETGAELHEQYAAGDPFPHIVIDNFLPESILRMCLDEFDQSRSDDQEVFDRAQERSKRQYRPDDMGERARNLFYTFNSRPFIRVIENITGIKGLIPDPYFHGGGFHEIHTGGHLSVHADFNHHVNMDLERRVNLLIYLNDDWKDEYGGQLELWANDMSECVQSVVPLFNRAAMFNTTSFSNHGNPNPINHPDGRSRKSIALYYYTATWDESKRSHTTQFRARPESGDKVDWTVKRRELVDDLLPPILRRSLAKMKNGKED
jgi:Rps23 Pro-64 3,4-dihydroxylase Tpa1-like proline 4-hydroxylase